MACYSHRVLCCCCGLLFQHCKFAFAAPDLSVLLLCSCVVDWLSGNRPNRCGSVLLHQFKDTLCNNSLHFYGTAYSEVCLCSEDHRLDHCNTCDRSPSCARINVSCLKSHYIQRKSILRAIRRRKSLSHLYCLSRKPVANEAFLLQVEWGEVRAA